jgi:hypothetical protein
VDFLLQNLRIGGWKGFPWGWVLAQVRRGEVAENVYNVNTVYTCVNAKTIPVEIVPGIRNRAVRG